MSTIHNIIFDLDGTLIDSSDGVVDAVNYSLRQMGEPEQSPERIKPYIGYPLSQMYPDFTSAPLAELYIHFQVRAAETVVISSECLEGADTVLREMHTQGFRLAIGTTKIRKHVEGIIDKFGWRSLLSAWVGGDDVKEVKPSPEAFELVLSRLGEGPEGSIVVGDTVNDILAARSVPMRSVAVLSPYGGREDVEASGPDHFLEQVSDLPGLIKKLNG